MAWHSRACIAVVAALLLSAPAGAGAPLLPPPSLNSSNGLLSVQLTVVAARLSSGSDFALATRAYAWRSGASSGGPALFGPTLRVRPGDTLRVTVVNTLGPDFGADAAWPMNCLRRYNTTNIHTHGLHVSPSQDNVFSSVAPGANLTYTYSIIAEHAPGTLWYHAHFHGATAIQVMGGLAGALIVEPSAALPSWLAALPEEVLVLQSFFFQSIGNPPGGHPAPSFSFLENAAYNGSAGYYASPTFGAPAYYTVNGLVAPALSLAAGASTVLRIVYAAGAETPTLSLQGGVSASCSLQVIALDGVYLLAPRPVPFVRMPPGTRADVVIGCAAPGAVNLSATATAFSYLAQTLVALTVTGAPASPAPLPASVAVARPWYLSDLTGVTPATFAQISVSFGKQFQFSAQGPMFPLGFGSNCSAVNTSAVPVSAPVSACPFIPFSGERGTNSSAYPAAALQVLGSPAQASVFGASTGPHPLHIHVNHFQIIAVGSGLAADNFSVVGDWRDTVAVGTGPGLSADAGTVIRWWPADFTGEVVVHCHILGHEDAGMMTTMLVSAPASAASAASLSTAQQIGLGIGIGVGLAAIIAAAVALSFLQAATTTAAVKHAQ